MHMLLTFYHDPSRTTWYRTLPAARAQRVPLCAIELLPSSGQLYRCPTSITMRISAADDLEGAAAGMTWWRALFDGVTLQARLWVFAFRHGRDRAWILGEGFGIVALAAASLAALPWTIAPLTYAALMILGSWLFPLITSFIPHDAAATTALTQTRLFRGRILSIVALEHLYHLEHHLYPQVPHHKWAELGRRLDPYFARPGCNP